MQRIQGDEHRLSFLDFILSIQYCFVLIRRHSPSGCSGIQAECLFQSGIDILEFLQVLEFDGFLSAHFVDFGSNGLVCSWGPKQPIGQERKQSTSSLVPWYTRGRESRYCAKNNTLDSPAIKKVTS